MNRTSFIHDLLRVLSPGRRMLSEKHKAEQLATLRAQELLIKEYQSLASLPTRNCNTSALCQMNHEDFKRFIKADERMATWKLIQPEISALELPEMAGGVNLGDQRLIYHLLEYLRPLHVLEIGTHIGASTVHIASAQRSLTGNKLRKLVSVDIRDINCPKTKPWEKFGSRYSPREMVDRLDQGAFVDFITMHSVEFLTKDQEKYDLIFLDGDHSANAVYQEIPLALDRLADGGCILLHDYFPALQPLWGENPNSSVAHADVIPGVYLAVQRLLREGCNFLVEPLGSLPWKTKLGSHTTSLAMLSRVSSP